MEFKESGIRFVFDDNQWNVLQLDKETDYKKIADTLPETKAIDFLGIHNHNAIYLFEVKSFRGHGSEESVRARLKNAADDLTTEIGQKVRDSLACLLAGARNSTNKDEVWKTYCRKIMSGEVEVGVIAWIEEDVSTSVLTARAKLKMSVRRDNLRKKLRWLSTKVEILNARNYNNSVTGLTVSLLPA